MPEMGRYFGNDSISIPSSCSGASSVVGWRYGWQELKGGHDMIGAIAGDIIGSVHEGAGTKTKRFPLFGAYNRFTDDTVLTITVAESLLRQSDLVDTLHEYFHRYPNVGFGGSWSMWASGW
jgi:hypothetical protein